MLKYVKLFCIFFVITVNAYAQKRDCCESPFDYSKVGIIYIDSIVVNGATVYTDSIVIDKEIVYKDSMIVNGSVVYTDSIVELRIENYPIALKNKLPFKYAVYRDACEYQMLMLRIIGVRLRRENEEKPSDEKERYCIFSYDDKCINYGLISEADGEFYTKYNPIDGGVSFPGKQYGKFRDYLRKEMDKELKVSVMRVGSGKKETYFVKSFASTL